VEPPLQIDGDAFRYDHRAGNDDYSQAGNLFQLLPADERHRLFRNIASSMQGVPRLIIDR
jgi:catalase